MVKNIKMRYSIEPRTEHGMNFYLSSKTWVNGYAINTVKNFLIALKNLQRMQ